MWCCYHAVRFLVSCEWRRVSHSLWHMYKRYSSWSLIFWHAHHNCLGFRTKTMEDHTTGHAIRSFAKWKPGRIKNEGLTIHLFNVISAMESRWIKHIWARLAHEYPWVLLRGCGLGASKSAEVVANRIYLHWRPLRWKTSSGTLGQLAANSVPSFLRQCWVWRDGCLKQSDLQNR